MTVGKNLTNMLTALEGVQENPYTPGFSVHINEVGQIVLTVEEDEVEPEPEPEPKPEIKFMYNGIKVNGHLRRAYIWKDNFNPAYSNFPPGTLTFVAKSYQRFPEIPGLTAVNNSDSQTDYFDDDKIYITPDSEYYEAAHAAFEKKQAFEVKQKLKRDQKAGRNNWI